jgi:uncharacterized membrane protein
MPRKNRYIDAVTFEDFCTNQKILIEIFNHRITGIEKSIINIKTDLSWAKKILWAIFGVIIVSFMTTLIKSVVGI